MGFRTSLLSMAVVLSLAGGASAAYAQNGGGGEPQQTRSLEEVIVTARRVQESQQDVPLAITAMTGDMLAQQGVFQVSDLSSNIPSMTDQKTTGRSTTMTFGIRGQMASDVVLPQDPAVGVYVADVVQVRPYGLGVLAMLDIASVEVVKGPQGTLFGRNTTGGAVLINPNTPQNDFSAELRLGYGWENQQSVGGTLNVPITDRMAFRVAAEDLTRDAYIDQRGEGDDFYDADQQSWRVSFRWDITDRLTTTFYTDGMRGKDDGATTYIRAVDPNGIVDNLYGNQGGDPVDLAEFLTDIQTPLPSEEGGFSRALREQQQADFYSTHVNNEPEAFTDTKVLGYSNTTVFDISEALSIKNIIGYREVDQTDSTDLDGTPFPALWAQQFVDADQVSEELQLIGEWSKFNFIVGLYYFKEEGTDGSISRALEDSLFTDTGLVNNPIFTISDSVNKSRSAFLQGTYRFTEAWSLTLGVRQTEDEREFTSRSRDAGGCNVADTSGGQPCARSASTEYREPTWNVSLEWAIAPEQLLYLAHRHGYRSGGFNARAQSDREFRPFDPEFVDDVEIGYKSEFSPGNQLIRFNAAAYYSDYTDIQRLFVIISPDFTVSNVILNAASATIYGGELELTWSPTPNLRINSFYSLTDASYDEWTSPTGEDFSDNSFRGIPRETAKLSVRYTWPSVRLGDLSVQAGAYVQSEISMWDREFPGAHQAGYALYDARIDWANVMGSELSVSAWGKNLANKEYNTGSLALYPDLGYTAAYHGTPRSWGVEFMYRF